jgi:flagellin-like hook-associated protein FlgL
MALMFSNPIVPTLSPHHRSATQKLTATATQLATGKKNVAGASLEANYSFGMKLKADVGQRRSYDMGMQYGIAQATAAQAQTDATIDILDRAVEIATEATNVSLSIGDRSTLQAEFEIILTAIDNIADQEV